MTRSTVFITALVVALTILSIDRRAEAQVACDSLPNPVYLHVADTHENLLKALGRQLRNSTTQPLTLVWLSSDDCVGLNTILDGTKVVSPMRYVPSAAEQPTWNKSMPPLSCTPPSSGAPVSVASTSFFIDRCGNPTFPASVTVARGPVGGFVFAVPLASTQTAITAEEAYLAFALGAEGLASPWVNESQLFIRPRTKGIRRSLESLIRAINGWHGVVLDSSPMVVASLQNALTPEAALGTLHLEVAEANDTSLKTLAYRTFRQRQAYFPGSVAKSKDRRNIRDGHYALWSSSHFLVRAAGNPQAEYVWNLLVDRPVSPDPGFDPLVTIVAEGLVPDCAMGVMRSVEFGELSLYAPTSPCGCFYASQVGQAPASCVACGANQACATGTCRHGYCEAR